MNNSRYWLNSVLVISERVVVLALSFFSAILMARYAGAEMFGQYATVLAFASLFLVFTQVGLNNICSKYFTYYPRNARFYIKTALYLRASIALAAVPLALCIAFFTLETSQDALLVTLLVTLQAGNAASVIEFYFLSKQQVTTTLLPRVIIKLLSKLALISAILLEFAIEVWVIVTGLEYVLLACAYLILCKKHPPPQNASLSSSIRYFKASKVLLHRGKWLLLSSIAAVLYLKLDQVMLAAMISKEEVAYYAAAAKLSEFWYVLPVLVANVLMPKLVALYQSDTAAYWQMQRKCYLYCSLIAVAVIVFTIALAKPLILTLFGSQYQASVLILQIHIFGCVFIFSRAFMSRWLVLSNNHKLSLHSHLMGAVVNITLNALLIPSYGGVGAAIASVIAYGVASIGFMVFYESTRGYLLKLCRRI